MPAPSGQIPPPWAWWENEAPTTRAADRPVPGRLQSLGCWGGPARTARSSGPTRTSSTGSSSAAPARRDISTRPLVKQGR
jgi:hypothetical protein